MLPKKIELLGRKAGGLQFGALAREELSWLLLPDRHPPLLEAQRADMLLSRTKLVAALFALLTPLWGVFDFLFFPEALARGLLVGRVLATLAFVALLALFNDPAGRAGNARLALLLLFSVPSLFFLHSAVLLEQHALAGMARALAATHAFLPFLVLAGLSIFPLTALEAALLALPILVAKAGAGLLVWPDVDWPQALGAFWLLLLIGAVATLASMSQLAFIIALIRNAIRDRLTGAFSRQGGSELLALLFGQSVRNETPLAVVFIDLDHFKRINDEHGHDAGDRALAEAARNMAGQLRAVDVLARWGGEEFVIAMPNATAAKAAVALGRLHAGGFGERPEGGPLTASIGIAERLEDQADDWNMLVELADARMYEAKQAGRNRIVTRPAAAAAAAASGQPPPEGRKNLE
jgi:diguanylate cyclase (GGDEF)-like protein